MRVAHGGRHAPVGDNSTHEQRLDPALAQEPLEPRHVESRIRDLLDGAVDGFELLDDGLSPRARRKVAALEERAQLLQVGRDDRFALAAGDEREQRGDHQAARLLNGARQRRHARRQGRDLGAALPAARIGAVRMNKVVLQVDEQKGRGAT